MVRKTSLLVSVTMLIQVVSVVTQKFSSITRIELFERQISERAMFCNILSIMTVCHKMTYTVPLSALRDCNAFRCFLPCHGRQMRWKTSVVWSCGSLASRLIANLRRMFGSHVCTIIYTSCSLYSCKYQQIQIDDHDEYIYIYTLYQYMREEREIHVLCGNSTQQFVSNTQSNSFQFVFPSGKGTCLHFHTILCNYCNLSPEHVTIQDVDRIPLEHTPGISVNIGLNPGCRFTDSTATDTYNRMLRKIETI